MEQIDTRTEAPSPFPGVATAPHLSGESLHSLLRSTKCELERLLIEEAIQLRYHHKNATTLIVPGYCDLTLELALRGVPVIACDTGEWTGIPPLLSESVRDKTTCLPIALGEIDGKLPHQPFAMALCRGGLSELPYPQARNAVKQLLRTLKIGGKFFLSARSLYSVLGEKYPDHEVEIERRFCELTPKIAKKYGIPGKVCLYSERDLYSLILEAGGKVQCTFTTTYGCIKAVAVRA